MGQDLLDKLYIRERKIRIVYFEILNLPLCLGQADCPAGGPEGGLHRREGKAGEATENRSG